MGTLQQLANDIWIADGDIVDFYGFPYPTRCVVVRLADGGLWVWSPIALTSGLRAEIEQLGQPAHLVSPNKIHHLYLQDWHAAYPEARLWGPQSTISKRTDLAFEAPLEDNPPEVWRQDIDQAMFALTNPTAA